MAKIAVGMSGGVDSSVAAYLLQQAGHEVFGVFMKNWEDEVQDTTYRKDAINGCSWEQDYADMRAVCDKLGIPYTTFNFVKEYRNLVFGTFLEELKAGRTPNPDIACNQEIKFHLFLEKALKQEGVTAIATGHYARIRDGKLCVPADRNKDQTYFLYRIDAEHLKAGRIYFPLQDLTKDEVRAIAQKQGFVNAEKKDSTGICFIGDIDYNQFIEQYIPPSPGNIEDTEGHVLGEHKGLHFFTIGQRHGINIGGTGPYYVIQKDIERQVLVVTNDTNDPGLFQHTIEVTDLHWLQEVTLPLECSVQVRYRQQPQSATIHHSTPGTVRVEFDTPQRAVTPGQSAVFYKDDSVLFGGIIL